MRRKQYKCLVCGETTSRIEERSKRWRNGEKGFEHLCVEVKDSTVEPIWSRVEKVDVVTPAKEEIPILQRQTLTINSIRKIRTAREYVVATRATKVSLAINVEVDDAMASALENMEKTARSWALTLTAEATQLEMVDAPQQTEQAAEGAPGDNGQDQAEAARLLESPEGTESDKEPEPAQV
jgi:hypothetical protein